MKKLIFILMGLWLFSNSIVAQQTISSKENMAKLNAIKSNLTETNNPLPASDAAKLIDLIILLSQQADENNKALLESNKQLTSQIDVSTETANLLKETYAAYEKTLGMYNDLVKKYNELYTEYEKIYAEYERLSKQQ